MPHTQRREKKGKGEIQRKGILDGGEGGEKGMSKTKEKTGKGKIPVFWEKARCASFRGKRGGKIFFLIHKGGARGGSPRSPKEKERGKEGFITFEKEKEGEGALIRQHK